MNFTPKTLANLNIFLELKYLNQAKGYSYPKEIYALHERTIGICLIINSSQT